MGAIGAHHGHSYAVQTIAFFLTMLFPGGVLAVLGGAFAERARRAEPLPAGD